MQLPDAKAPTFQLHICQLFSFYSKVYKSQNNIFQNIRLKTIKTTNLVLRARVSAPAQLIKALSSLGHQVPQKPVNQATI